MIPRKRILFVCTSNQLRSVTAENIYKDDRRFEVLSCGTDEYARVRIHPNLIEWSDIIVCMEQEHKHSVVRRLFRKFPAIFVLGIEDNYDRDQPELVELIRGRFESVLEEMKMEEEQ